MFLQLPSSCIRQATIMAARLEAVVNSRARNRHGKNWLLKSLVTDQKKEAQDEMLESPECLHVGWSPVLEETNGGAYQKFFMNLKAAIIDVDGPVQSFQYLNHARSIARELISR